MRDSKGWRDVADGITEAGEAAHIDPQEYGQTAGFLDSLDLQVIME